jgi:hypothetical protein
MGNVSSLCPPDCTAAVYIYIRNLHPNLVLAEPEIYNVKGNAPAITLTDIYPKDQRRLMCAQLKKGEELVEGFFVAAIKSSHPDADKLYLTTGWSYLASTERRYFANIVQIPFNTKERFSTQAGRERFFRRIINASQFDGNKRLRQKFMILDPTVVLLGQFISREKQKVAVLSISVEDVTTALSRTEQSTSSNTPTTPSPAQHTSDQTRLESTTDVKPRKKLSSSSGVRRMRTLRRDASATYMSTAENRLTTQQRASLMLEMNRHLYAMKLSDTPTSEPMPEPNVKPSALSTSPTVLDQTTSVVPLDTPPSDNATVSTDASKIPTSPSGGRAIAIPVQPARRAHRLHKANELAKSPASPTSHQSSPFSITAQSPRSPPIESTMVPMQATLSTGLAAFNLVAAIRSRLSDTSLRLITCRALDGTCIKSVRPILQHGGDDWCAFQLNLSSNTKEEDSTDITGSSTTPSLCGIVAYLICHADGTPRAQDHVLFIAWNMTSQCNTIALDIATDDLHMPQLLMPARTGRLSTTDDPDFWYNIYERLTDMSRFSSRGFVDLDVAIDERTRIVVQSRITQGTNAKLKLNMIQQKLDEEVSNHHYSKPHLFTY